MPVQNETTASEEFVRVYQMLSGLTANMSVMTFVGRERIAPTRVETNSDPPSKRKPRLRNWGHLPITAENVHEYFNATFSSFVTPRAQPSSCGCECPITGERISQCTEQIVIDFGLARRPRFCVDPATAPLTASPAVSATV